MESQILDCAQGIFDRIECSLIQYRPHLLDEISMALGQKIWLAQAASEDGSITEDLADIINIMDPKDLQSVHVLVYGKEFRRTDVIPF